ncbi:MAG: efflux RND transporter periplasmic adaptor subunit [Candidatus Ornithospirochaeta sp.]
MDNKENKDKILTESEIQEKKLRDAKAARKRRKRIKSLVGWLVVVLIVSLVLVWFLKMKKDSEAQIEALKSMQRSVEAVVERSTYDREIDISGYVVPYDTLEAKFRSTGAVTGVFVKEGDYVTEGQILATIDDTQQRMNLQDIENQIAEAKISGSARNLELLEMRKKNYENALDYTTLKANFDGVVSKVDVVVNDYFDAGSSAVTIIDRSRLKTTVEIDEIDMQYVTLGQKAILHFDSVPGVDVEAYVSYIPMTGRYTTQGIGVVDVELTIENPPENLISGFTFSGSLSFDGDVEMLLIPSSAVSTGRGGQTSVKVKNDDGTTSDRKVTVQYLGEGMSQVLSGLKEGEVVVYEPTTSNPFAAMMGMMGGF